MSTDMPGPLAKQVVSIAFQRLGNQHYLADSELQVVGNSFVDTSFESTKRPSAYDPVVTMLVQSEKLMVD